MLDIEIIKMAFTWVFMYMSILAQNFSDGYGFNSFWMFAVIPFLLRFMNGSGLLHVKWAFLLAIVVLSGALAFAFSLTNPQLQNGLKEYGRNKRNTVRFTFLYMGFLLFSLLFLGYFWRDGPFADPRVVMNVENLGMGNNNI